MQIPESILVKNSSGQKVAFLSPTDGMRDCSVDCRINAESTLEFYLPVNSEKLGHLTPECKIYTHERVYSLLKEDAIDITMDQSGKQWAKVMTEEIWNELDAMYIEPYLTNDPTVPIPADLAVIIVGGGTDLSDGLYSVGTAAHALYAVLNGSGWTIGTVDVTGIHDLEMEKVSRLTLIKSIHEIWGGNLLFDSINKTVSLRASGTWQNYTGFQVRYAKNMKNITRTQSNKLITKLYPFGKDNLDIASVNGGNKFITNNSYTSNTYVNIYTNPDVSDPQELMDAAEIYLDMNCRPKYTYSIKIDDLRTLPEYSHEDFSVGDMADVIHDGLNIYERLRINRHKYNLFQPWKCELELGDPNERLEEKLSKSFKSSKFVDNTFTNYGEMSGFKLEDLSVANEKIESISADKITAGVIEALIEIIGPIIRTAKPPNRRIEISDNQFRTYNDSDVLNGFCTNNTSENMGDVEIYDGSVGKLVFRIYNALLGEGVSLIPENGASLKIGSEGEITHLAGNQYFDDNCTGVIQYLTQAEALAKTDWLPNQLVEITDEELPLIADNLTSTSTTEEIANKINNIIQALDGWMLRRS